ncbi:MAG: exodeoxyribonuclease VII small subunit [Candidatus Heteroscillospira sp.]|jgi:exodeoxyribonuclease VII small subunit
MEKNEMSFEQSMQRLDEIVKLLERGDAPLEQLLSLFEEGTSLIRSCGSQLDAAEQKVVRLRKGADGTPEELPFEAQQD